MKRIAGNKKGQFVIIAVLLVAIMIVSIGALLHGAATYYKHEPWEEYSAVISDIELNTRRLLEQSLVDYTQSGDPNVLKDNMIKWQSNLSSIYPDKGITLDFILTNKSMEVNKEMLDFKEGLVRKWNQSTSVSSARADLSLDIASIGLSGYRFTAETFLKLRILSNDSSTNKVEVVVYGENNIPISDLKKENFRVNNNAITNMTASYRESYSAVTYTIYYPGENPPMVEVRDQRGIHVTAFP